MPRIILLVDDDEDDALFSREAFRENGVPQTNIIWLKDGTDLMDYISKSPQRN